MKRLLDWLRLSRGWRETRHLSRRPINAERLLRSIQSRSVKRKLVRPKSPRDGVQG